METQLFTVHSRGRPDEFVAIGDARRPLGVVPPVWAIWRGLWLTAGVMIVVLALVGYLLPQALGAVWLALVAVAVLEGASIERAERRLFGWREVAMVEARTEEGAEELFLTGKAI